MDPPGAAWRGTDRRLWRGEARTGLVRNGSARRGTAGLGGQGVAGVGRSGLARPGTAWHGEARLRPGPPRYFLMRLVRGGALLPARLQWLDCEPDEPSNKLDRWPPFFPQVDIGGEIRPPEELLERFSWGPSHWKHAAPISRQEYEHAFAHLRWSETNRASDPTLRPRRRVSAGQVPLPDFTEENNAL